MGPVVSILRVAFLRILRIFQETQNRNKIVDFSFCQKPTDELELEFDFRFVDITNWKDDEQLTRLEMSVEREQIERIHPYCTTDNVSSQP